MPTIPKIKKASAINKITKIPKGKVSVPLKAPKTDPRMIIKIIIAEGIIRKIQKVRLIVFIIGFSIFSFFSRTLYIKYIKNVKSKRTTILEIILVYGLIDS